MTVTSKPALLFEDIIPDATLSVEAGTVESSAPVTNLATPFVSQAMRFSSASVTVRATFGANPVAYDYVALIGVGGASDATIRWIIDDDIDAAGALTYDSGTIDAFDFTRPEIATASWPVGGRHVIAFPTAGVTGDELQFVYNPGTSPSSKTIGGFRAGRLWQPEKFLTTNWELTPGSPRKWNLTFETDRDGATEISSLIREHRFGKRLLFVPRPLSTEEWIREVIYCRISNADAATETYRSGSTRRFALEFTEVLT